jgi:hypothetical protein
MSKGLGLPGRPHPCFSPHCFSASKIGPAHAVEMPPMGQQPDGYEWLLFIAAHSRRHTEQLEEVKADPNFPKS